MKWPSTRSWTFPSGLGTPHHVRWPTEEVDLADPVVEPKAVKAAVDPVKAVVESVEALAVDQAVGQEAEVPVVVAWLLLTKMATERSARMRLQTE